MRIERNVAAIPIFSIQDIKNPAFTFQGRNILIIWLILAIKRYKCLMALDTIFEVR